MSTTKTLFFVFIGVFAVLILSSLIAWMLKVRHAPHQPHQKIDYLNSRINAWWAFTIFLGLAIWIGELGVIILFGFISLQCLREYISITKTRISDHHALIWSFYFFLPVQYFLLAMGWGALFSILIPVCAFLLLPITSVLRGDTKQFLARAAQVQWGLMICVYFLSHVPALLALDIPEYEGRNALLVVFLLIVAQTNNAFEYIWDKLMGSYKLVPSISATKTLEGLIVGLLCSMLLGALLYWITPFNPFQAALMALVIGLVGFAGRLVLTAIKQDRGLRNWGYRGGNDNSSGMLDLVDSIAFAAPVFFYLVSFFWAQQPII